MSSNYIVPLAGTLSMVRDKLSIPFGKVSVEISTTSFITVSDFISYLHGQGVPNIKLFTLEGQPILGSTHLQTIKHLPLYISINEAFYKIIPRGTVCHYSTIDLYDSLNLSARDRTMLQANVRHLNNLFTSSDLIPKDLLIDTIHSLVRIGNNDYLEDKKRMINLECERAEMLEEYKVLKKRSETYAWMMLWIGFFISAFQCSYIGIGTYMIYSWDFMEPQAYAINLGNFIFAYGAYALRKQEISREKVFDLLANRRLKHISKVQGFDLERFDEVSEELEKLKKKY